jgi:glyoxylase-like metal-dependent hydrolase (beta-lactamase superfamily II)
MDKLNATTRLLDLKHLGHPQVIATAVIDTMDGVLLVDPGPASCLQTLLTELPRAGVGARALRGVLLTHIHLDHAGACGALVRTLPHLKVYVAERGAPHLIDPGKLVASAARMYGTEMDRLWGEIVPVPRSNIHMVYGGDRLNFEDRFIEVRYTPGHASHHVSYRDTLTGIAFTGDVTGVRHGTAPFVVPPTTPPDVDLGAWRQSLTAIRDWQPTGLFLTHFGLKADVNEHLDLMLSELEEWARISQLLRSEADDDIRHARFVEQVAARMTERLGAKATDVCRAAVSLDQCWMGLDRYWATRTS